MMFIIDFIKRHWLSFVAVTLLSIVGYECGKRSQRDDISKLRAKLESSEKTLELEHGLFLKRVTEVQDIASKLDRENQELIRLVKNGKKKIIALNELTLKWKKAYESSVDANQTDVPPAIPGEPARKRIDFTGSVGPIKVVGYTMTDPPKAFLKWEQVDPLRLIVSITRNHDKTYSTIVKASSNDIAVDVSSSLLDLSVLRPAWYQMIWVDLGLSFLGDPAASIGLSYHGDRFSFGPSCFAASSAYGCGLVSGVRIFR